MASERTEEWHDAPASRWGTLMQCVVAPGPRLVFFVLIGAAVLPCPGRVRSPVKARVDPRTGAGRGGPEWRG